MKNKTFKTKAELFKFLKENKLELISEKKYKVKEADSIIYSVAVTDNAGKKVSNVKKDNGSSESPQMELAMIKVGAVINTTNLMDSHSDVHIPGLWKKSLSENKNLFLLQEHQMCFEKIITSDVKAATKKMTWKELGFSFDGETEALVFDCNIDSERNPYMFEQYVKGRVNNHSVGMRYVNLFLCINSDEKYLAEEKANWDKYISKVVNSDVAQEQGYFWAVTEAKVIEGSAVVLGSNYATPTISIEDISSTIDQPSNDTGKQEPSENDTQKDQENEEEQEKEDDTTKKINFEYLTNNFKL